MPGLWPRERPLLSHRLIFVTGKGGVGKSTVSAALAIASAQSGLRTLLAEFSRPDRVRPASAHKGPRLEEVELSPGLFSISIDPDVAMEEYLRIRLGALGRALGSTKPFQALMTATPGMREMQTMAKVWELAHPDRPAGGRLAYDVVIVDAPSTFHAMGLLRTPRTFAGVASVGPVANGARMIDTMITDPAFTGFVAVTTADAAAVTETLQLRDALKADGLSLSTVVLNRLHPDRFTPEEITELEGCAVDAPAALQSALRAAEFEHQLARLEGAQVQRIAARMDLPLVTLPFLALDQLGQAAVHTLANALAPAWPEHAAQTQL